MRWFAWLGLILFFGLLALDVYLYLDRYRPLERRYQELLARHTRLLSELPAQPSETTEPPAAREPSLLEGLSSTSTQTQHRLSASFKTLDLFVKWSDRFKAGATRLLEELLVGVQPSEIQRITVQMYQGPYKTLTRKRLRALKRWFVSRGIPESKIRTVPTDRIAKWHTRVVIELR